MKRGFVIGAGAALLAVTALSLTAGGASAGQCSDPWVTQAVTKYLHRAPASASAPECNINLYRNGHWNSYAELDSAVDAYWATHAAPGASPAPSLAVNRNAYVNLNGRSVAVASLRHNGSQVFLGSQVVATIRNGHLVGPSGGTLVAQGGGNLVAAGGGNIVSQGGGN